MAWHLRQWNKNFSATDGDDATVTLHTAPQEGNLVVVLCVVDEDVDAGINYAWQNGYSEIIYKVPYGGSNHRFAMAYKVAGASESTTITLDFDPSDVIQHKFSMVAAEFSGNTPTPFMSGTENSFGNGSSYAEHPIATAADTTHAGALIVAGFDQNNEGDFVADPAGRPYTASGAPQLIARQDIGGNQHKTQMAYAIAGPVGTYGVQLEITSFWGSRLIAAFAPLPDPVQADGGDGEAML